MLGLCAVGRYERQPVDDEGEQPDQSKHSDRADPRAALAPGKYDEPTDCDTCDDSNYRVAVLVCHGANHRQAVALTPMVTLILPSEVSTDYHAAPVSSGGLHRYDSASETRKRRPSDLLI